MYSLRQKTYGVFIRPYIEFGGDRLIERGKLSAASPCVNTSSSCPQYIQVKDGENWVLYKGEYITSYALVRERVKEIMDNLGYSKNDIIVSEVIPLDHIITPLT